MKKKRSAINFIDVWFIQCTYLWWGFHLYRLREYKLLVFSCTAILMEMRILGFHNILAILLPFFAYFWLQIEGSFDSDRLQRKLITLYKILDYVNRRPQQMNVDLTYGITLTEANLIAAFKHKNMQYLERQFYDILKELVELSDLTRRNLMINVIPLNKNEFLLQSTLNYPSLWIRPISWTKISQKFRITFKKKLNYSEIVESLWHGTPNGTESDVCLIEIMYNSLNKIYQIPQICIEMLTRDDDTTGYPLTHRLFIIQTIKAFRLQKTVTSFSYLISTYCAKIFQDLVNLEAWNFPNPSRDLMIEQILLCGMEGYSEFINKRYEDLILSWSHSSGCFRSFIKSLEKHKVTRRSTRLTDFGCDSHMTGLAAACLSIFIRENIENAFSQS